jgi:hypothetical protein
MAVQARTVSWDGDKRRFDMHALKRMALWGFAATCALGAAAMSANSSGGLRRLSSAVATATGQEMAERPTGSTVPPRADRSAETEEVMRRLADMVRALAADRDRLFNRIASLERSLEDVTGSIKSTTTLPAAGPTSPSSPATAASPTAAAVVAPEPELTPPAAETASSSGPEAAPSQPAAEAQTTPAHGPRLAKVQTAEESAELEPAKPRTEFGVDIGGGLNFDALRALWASSRTAAHAALFEGLQPVVVARETKTRTVELRLVVGPLASFEAAVRLCSNLSAARRPCQLAMYEGQLLPATAPASEPQRRPAAPAAAPAPDRKAAPVLRQPVRPNPQP